MSAIPVIVRYPSYDMLRGALKSIASPRHQAWLLGAWLLIPAVAAPDGPGLAPTTGRVLLSVEGRITVTEELAGLSMKRYWIWQLRSLLVQ